MHILSESVNIISHCRSDYPNDINDDVLSYKLVNNIVIL
jgi:hypothetical protein